MVVSLLDNRYLHQRTGEFPAALSDYMPFEIMLPPETFDPQKNKLQEWLSHVGLNLNPFEYIDAGEDPLIPFYLIDHNQFDKINGNQPSFVFASAGGGKTAFRVRLARECRAGRNGRRIFPIVFKPTSPGNPNEDPKKSALHQRTDLLRYASQELLLHLAYYPYVLDEMDAALRKVFLQIITWDLDFSIFYYLNQMKEAESLDPIITALDPTARSLPNPPDREDILYLYKKLSHYSSDKEKPDAEKRLDLLFDLILNKLEFEAIYILVDGVDAFLETVDNPKNALASIYWLLDSTLPWMQNRIYVKYFLPNDMRPIVTETPAFRLLTSKSKVVKIRWDADALSEVIRQRLQEASGGKFDSLTAISDRALRASGRSPEELLISDLRRHKKLSPRSLIRAVNWLFTNHVQEERVREKLSPQDLKAVREWIRREYSVKA
ncbi:hypothetical protein FBQ99_18515 [Chloroflexi bacterium CFX2]|nr:hypothetical protein [Chloroflexi bacterium CFX2]